MTRLRPESPLGRDYVAQGSTRGRVVGQGGPALGAALAALLATACSPEPPPEAGANLLLISLDTLRADHLQPYGYDRETSPHLADLAKRSVLFERVYSQAPTTAPSHATILSGRYPSAHGVEFVSPGTAGRIQEENPLAITSMDPGVPLLAEILGEAGWNCEAVTGGGMMLPAIGFDRGFRRFLASSATIRPSISDRVAEGRQAVARLRSETAPWFLLMHTYEPHRPYLPPEGWDRWSRDTEAAQFVRNTQETWATIGRMITDPAGLPPQISKQLLDMSADTPIALAASDLYDGGIAWTDEVLGSWLAEMDRQGHLDDTVTVVTSDHGEEFGEAGIIGHGALHESILHVPLLIHLPGNRLAGTRISAPTALVDVLPTLLDLLDVPPPGRLDGHSLVRAMNTGALEPTPQFSEVRRRTHGTWVASVRTGRWAYAERIEPARMPKHLYDLIADPAAENNLVPQGLAALKDWQPPVEVTRALEKFVLAQRAADAARTPTDAPELSPEELERLHALGY